MTVVPQAALDWLFGEKPDANGKWFGECEDAALGPIGKFPRRYWWRSKFRAMIKDAALLAAQPESLPGCQLRGPGECQKEGKCLSASCVHYNKTWYGPRMTLEAQDPNVLYPKETT